MVVVVFSWNRSWFKSGGKLENSATGCLLVRRRGALRIELDVGLRLVLAPCCGNVGVRRRVLMTPFYIVLLSGLTSEDLLKICLPVE